MKHKALVFDFDGLILDTEGPDFQSWQECYAEHGCELPLDVWAHCIGVPAKVFDPAAHLETLAGRPLNAEALRRTRRERFYELLEGQTPLDGVETCLRDATRLGLGLAVASSATRDWVVPHLERHGLLHYFQSIRCCEDVPRAKPHPDLFLAAVGALGVKPEEAVAFEDSPNGIRAAKRAGLYCVAVPNPVTRQLPLDEADLVLSSLAELPLEELLARLQAED
jgi:HAD superfamily hydrolase (TIGR01509 family)